MGQGGATLRRSPNLYATNLGSKRTPLSLLRRTLGAKGRRQSLALGQNFPVSEYYRECIVDAFTINRTGTWWSAALLIRDPKTHREFVGLYKFQKRGGVWKVRQKIHVNSSSDATRLAEALSSFARRL